MAPKDRAREEALAILRRGEQGAHASPLLETMRGLLDHRDQAFVLELVYGTLRNRSLLDWHLDRFCAQPIKTTDSWTRNILRLGAYQLLFMDRVPPRAAVSTATELAKGRGRKPGFVNGILRTLDRSRSALAFPDRSDLMEHLAVRYSHPAWLVCRWVARFGVEEAVRLLECNNLPAPLILRTNIVRTTRTELITSLVSQGAHAEETAWSPQGVLVREGPGLRELTAYERGWFMVQDEAAQLVGLILSPRPGDSVLDACAAPGGKATHLAELMGDTGSIVALDEDAERLARVTANCARLGLSCVTPTTGDATTFRDGLYDRVLIDAPCSGLGVLRRHPDGRWTKTEASIRERCTLQHGILENCTRLLKPGGVLVYATCTTEPEENEDMVRTFLGRADSLFRLDDPRPHLPAAARPLVDAEGFLHTYPQVPEIDGFFAARIVRSG